MILWEIIATAWFLIAFLVLFFRWIAQSGQTLPLPFSEPLPIRSGEIAERTTKWKVFLLAITFRVIMLAVMLFVYNVLTRNTVRIGNIPELWTRWDAKHYIRLADLGYGGYIENGKPLFLVFFPLYVWLTRVTSWVIPHTALAGMLVSVVCFALGSTYLYCLVVEEYGSGIARRTLLFLWTFPFSFFFGGIMTESLFLLTTVAGLYHIRKHQWGRAALWGILAAMTRMQGVLLIGAACAEIFCEVKLFAKHGKERTLAYRTIAKQLPFLVAPLFGSLVYFALNWEIAGDPFAFTEMQNHWSQGFQWFPRVLAYLTKNALTWSNKVTRWEMWIPELLLFPILVFILWKSWKKHRSMFTLYAFVYLILNYCLSWLLSAGRYLSCGVPYFLFAADELEGHPGLTKGIAVGMLLLQCVFCFRYLCWGQVM